MDSMNGDVIKVKNIFLHSRETVATLDKLAQL